MKKLNKGELAGYIIAGIILLAGFGLFISSIVGYYLPEGNWIESASWLGLNLRNWSYIAIALGLIILVAVLLTHAKKADVDADRRAKRAARLGE